MGIVKCHAIFIRATFTLRTLKISFDYDTYKERTYCSRDYKKILQNFIMLDHSGIMTKITVCVVIFSDVYYVH